MDLSNRDIAFLLWLVIFAGFLLARRDTRGPARGVLSALRGRVGGIIVAYAVYIAIAVLLAQRLGVWNVGLAKDTIAWFLIPGLVLLFGFSKAYEGGGYYRRTFLRVIGLTALIEFYVNLSAFPLVIEIVLLPLALLLGATSALSDLKPETKSVKPVADRLLGLVGLVIFGGTAVIVVRDWDTIDKAELLLSFALPIWLTAVTLPFVFLFSLYANYELTFVRIDLATKDDPPRRRRAKLALLAAFHVRNRELHRFAGRAPGELASAQSWGDARRIIAYHRAEARVEEAKKDLAAKKLVRYAGVPGTDWEGQPLDQREFEDTRATLQTLASLHEAQYQNGRYRADVIDEFGILLSSKQLPDPAIASDVKRNGRAWFAWRRTVGGWFFGIGATGPPPDRWTYEGEDPPIGYPRMDQGWRRGDFGDEAAED
ncbi:MAG: hypothetical protein M3082_11675 [Candidatus Dormibacteraeota bacterium]|nr:hypothetical protein [Candidatus Dormibacteraeota bacterium]